MGVNAYYLQEEATRSLRRGELEAPYVEETFRKAKAMGARLVRTWAFNDAPAKRGDTAIQLSPLEYDETALRGLDLVLSRARAHGVSLVLPLGNYWDDYGGARQYVAWAGLPEPREGDPRFFTEPKVVGHYREHVRRLLGRVSSVDGVHYGAHPAVYAWELLNEPRAKDLAPGQLRGWVDEVGAQVKALAPGHLVGTGEEGFEGFRDRLAPRDIGLGSIHFFPESWGIHPGEAASAGARWIAEHAEQAEAEGKPLLLGEFGLRNRGAFSLEERRAMYRGWLRCARLSGLAGAAVWTFSYDARPEEWDLHTFYFRDGTEPADPVNRYADLLIEAAR